MHISYVVTTDHIIFLSPRLHRFGFNIYYSTKTLLAICQTSRWSVIKHTLLYLVVSCVEVVTLARPVQCYHKSERNDHR